MKETRNILLGFEFGENASQICYYDRQKDDALSLPIRVGQPEAAFPNCISTADGVKWHFGPEAQYFSSEKGESYVSNLYELCQSTRNTYVCGKEYTPGELMAVFLRESLCLLGLSDPVKKITSFVVTTPRITRTLVKNIRTAFRILGLQADRCFVQEYEESFFYETFSSRVDSRGRKVGLFIFRDDEVSFACLDVNQKVRPAIVTYRAGRRITLSNEPADRDLEFYTLINESLGNDNYAAIYLVGQGFSREWAVKSIPLLCRSQRKVFMGDNLYARGACQAAREKVEDKRLKSYLYVGGDMVRHNVSMDMIMGGAMGSYPLVAGGVNWYDAMVEYELILDKETALRFVISDMNSKEKKTVAMNLPELPERPPKATRLRVHLEFSSAKHLEITVTDLGFGDMYPSSGKIWKETLIG